MAFISTGLFNDSSRSEKASLSIETTGPRFVVAPDMVPMFCRWVGKDIRSIEDVSVDRPPTMLKRELRTANMVLAYIIGMILSRVV